MSRFVNVDAIHKKYDKYANHSPIGRGHGKTLARFLDWLDEQPTADVREVVYGEWIPVNEADADYNQEYECSECHKHDVHAVSQEVPYCWWCGARMI